MKVAEEGKFVRKPKKKKYQWQAFLWILIPFAFLIVFCYYPPISAFIESLFTVKNVRIDGVLHHNVRVFVGFDNYKNILTNDAAFWVCVKNVLIFTIVGMICGNFMTIFLAELLFNLKNKRLSAFFRVLFIIPILVPGVVVLLIWKYVVYGSNGLMDSLCRAFGGEAQQWYWSDNNFIAKFSILFYSFPWVAGTSFLIYLAGLQGIPKSVMEASQLDKCSFGKRLVKIDMPLIISQLKYFLVMGVIGGVQNFDLQLILVGGETEATDVLGLYLFDRAMGNAYLFGEGVIKSDFGYASAIGMILLVVTMCLSIINMQLNKDKSKKKIKKKVYKLRKVKTNEEVIENA